MAKVLTMEGNIHYEPANAGAGSSDDFDMRWVITVGQVVPYNFDLAAALNAPFAVAVPLPAKVVALRVMSGGPVTLLLSGPGGSDQAIQVADRLQIGSAAAPFTAVKLAGTATVELLVAG